MLNVACTYRIGCDWKIINNNHFSTAKIIRLLFSTLLFKNLSKSEFPMGKTNLFPLFRIFIFRIKWNTWAEQKSLESSFHDPTVATANKQLILLAYTAGLAHLLLNGTFTHTSKPFLFHRMYYYASLCIFPIRSTMRIVCLYMKQCATHNGVSLFFRRFGIII